MHTERTFRTDGGRDSAIGMTTLKVSGLTCRVKKITISDEGKLSMAIDGAVTDDESIDRLRDLLTIQQGEVMLTLEGATPESSGESLQ